MRILLADAQVLVRQAMADALNAEPGLRVVAQVGSGTEILAACRRHDVTLVLLETDLPGLSGLDAVEELRAEMPHIRVVVVTHLARPGYLQRAADLGVSGYIVKSSPWSALVGAVRRAEQGLRTFDGELLQDSQILGPCPLSIRERQVLAGVARMQSTGQIGEDLGLTPGTVRNHLSSAIGKLGAASRTDAARIALQLGWLLPVSDAQGS